MVNEYFKAANEVMELAHQCEDMEIISILKAGSLRIFELAESNSGIFKHPNLENTDVEEAFTGTE